MAVETAEDRASFIADFGVDVTWRGSTMRAIFDRPTAMSMALSEVDLVDRHPTICFPEATLPVGAVENDVVSILDDFAVTHSFRCKTIRLDGTGYVVVDLKL